ncbi:hypothetical protein BSKO_05034 [Bryopsis sp. KO-2023]|nr:hypothetical protein BSKO_05034 [Bryopsis sp. KO-2023]
MENEPPVEKFSVSYLRDAIRSHLREEEVSDELKKFVKGDDVQQILDELKNSGFVDKFVTSISQKTSHGDLTDGFAEKGGEASHRISGRRLFVAVKRGRGLLEYVPHGAPNFEGVYVCGELFGQRFRSEIVPAAPEVDFQRRGCIHLPEVTLPNDPNMLLNFSQQLHLVMIATQTSTLPSGSSLYDEMKRRVDASRGESSSERTAPRLIGVCCVDWRKAMTAAGRDVQIVAEFVAPHQCERALVGTVEVRVGLEPGFLCPLAKGILTAHQEQERQEVDGALSKFHKQLDQFWATCVKANPLLRKAPLVLSVRGEDDLERPCCSFVRPLQLSRLIACPREAARFISLFNDRISSSNNRCWLRLHSLLALKSATEEERALLLCSILLGFGLDAWVCWGVGLNGEQSWVLTIDGESQSLWDVHTGHQYELPFDSASAPPLVKLNGAFNHESVQVNVGEEVPGQLMIRDIDFDDPFTWKRLRVTSQTAMGSYWSGVDLAAPSYPVDIEVGVETAVRRIVCEHRRETHDIQRTRFDESLEHMLMPLLVEYENEVLLSASHPQGGGFHEGIKKHIPKGWMVQGVPHHFNHADVVRIGCQLFDDETTYDLFGIDIPGAKFMIRAKASVYPDGFVSLWVLIGVKYPSRNDEDF